MVDAPASSHLAGTRLPGPTELARHAAGNLEATLVVRRRTPCKPFGHYGGGEAGEPIDHEEFRRRHAAHDDDLQAVENWVRRRGLKVLATSALRRTVLVGGPRLVLARELSPPRGAPVGTPPESLQEQVKAVIGLEEHPLAHTHQIARGLLSDLPARPGSEGRSGSKPSGGGPAGGLALAEAPESAVAAGPSKLTVGEVAELYRFPAGRGEGQTIGVLALAGGYHPQDLQEFAAAAGIEHLDVVDILVHGELPEGAAARGANDPVPMEELAAAAGYLDTLQGDPPSPRAIFTVETTMDVELALGFAPGARIAVYFAAGNDEHAFYQALSTAVFDRENRPSVLSLSWGWPESSWKTESGEHFVAAVEELLNEAAHLGITFCASSGDDGSGGTGENAWVQYPASSPLALTCGGTTLEVVGGRITSEVAWRQTIGETVYASGGGVSRLFGQPSWQRGVKLLDDRRARGVPDVSGVADRGAGCAIRIGGRTITSGGTSAVAPMWAGLIARLVQTTGRRLGHCTPRLYRLAAADSTLFQDVVEGGNGDYQASAGWDPCTGLGSPHGRRLAMALAATES